MEFLLMKYLSLILVLFTVPVVLAIFTKTQNTDSIYNFEMRMSKKILFLVIPGALLFGVCLYGSSKAGQTGATTVIFGVLFILSALLALPLIKGFYDEEVSNDTLIKSRFWRKKSISINEIEKCVLTNGGIVVYVRGKKFTQIESVYMNLDNFLERMSEEGIPVENKTTGVWKNMR